MCAQLLCVPNNIPLWQKADLQERKVNDTKARNIHEHGNKHCSGKEWKPYTSSLGCN